MSVPECFTSKLQLNESIVLCSLRESIRSRRRHNEVQVLVHQPDNDHKVIDSCGCTAAFVLRNQDIPSVTLNSYSFEACFKMTFVNLENPKNKRQWNIWLSHDPCVFLNEFETDSLTLAAVSLARSLYMIVSIRCRVTIIAMLPERTNDIRSRSEPQTLQTVCFPACICVCVGERHHTVCKPVSISYVLALVYNRLTDMPYFPVPVVNKSLDKNFRSIMINCDFFMTLGLTFNRIYFNTKYRSYAVLGVTTY